MRVDCVYPLLKEPSFRPVLVCVAAVDRVSVLILRKSAYNCTGLKLENASYS